MHYAPRVSPSQVHLCVRVSRFIFFMGPRGCLFPQLCASRLPSLVFREPIFVTIQRDWSVNDDFLSYFRLVLPLVFSFAWLFFGPRKRVVSVVVLLPGVSLLRFFCQGYFRSVFSMGRYRRALFYVPLGQGFAFRLYHASSVVFSIFCVFRGQGVYEAFEVVIYCSRFRSGRFGVQCRDGRASFDQFRPVVIRVYRFAFVGRFSHLVL